MSVDGRDEENRAGEDCPDATAPADASAQPTRIMRGSGSGGENDTSRDELVTQPIPRDGEGGADDSGTPPTEMLTQALDREGAGADPDGEVPITELMTQPLSTADAGPSQADMVTLDVSGEVVAPTRILPSDAPPPGGKKGDSGEVPVEATRPLSESGHRTAEAEAAAYPGVGVRPHGVSPSGGLSESGQWRKKNHWPTDPVLGKQVDAYQVQSVLGQGGFGRVYLAEDVNLGRKTALKFLTATASASELEKFDIEARLLAKVSRHPAVVEIYSYGNLDGRPYFALEYMPGSAEQLLKKNKGGLPVEDALRIVADCAAGLDYAHSQGVLHCDIKPANILLDPETGQAKLADFGLAKMSATTPDGAKRELVGTPPYMAPEQFNGKSADHRTDIFALGVTLYELLSGRLPFEGQTSKAIISKIVNNDAVPLHQHRAELPKTVFDIVARATFPDPAQRYASAGDMAKAINDLLHPTRVTTRRAFLVLSLVAGVLLGGVVVAAILAQFRADEPFAPLPSKYSVALAEAFEADEQGQFGALRSLSARDLALPTPPPLSIAGFGAYREAYADMRNNLFAKAEGKLLEAIAASPDEQILLSTLDYFPRRELGAVYLALGRYEDAVTAFRASYNTLNTERALELVRLAVGEMHDVGAGVDTADPSLDGKAVREPQYQPRRRRVAFEYVQVSAEVRDDFLVHSIRFLGPDGPILRLLPPRLEESIQFAHRARIRKDAPELTVEVTDCAGNVAKQEMDPEGESTTLGADFAPRATLARLVPGWVEKMFQTEYQVVYAAEEAVPGSLLEGTEIKIEGIADGDVVFRSEAYLDWSVRSKNTLEEVLVAGSPPPGGLGATRALKGGTWTPVDVGLNTLEVMARGKGDPLDQAARKVVSVERKEVPQPVSSGTYLASPASHPRLAVLAFEQTGGEVAAGTIRELLEETFETGFDGRFDLMYFSQIAGLLSEHQRTTALASQDEARLVARALPIDVFLCGTVVSFGAGAEVVAKLLDARTGQLIASSTVYVYPEEDLAARVEELAGWLVESLPRLVAVVGKVETLETPRGPQAIFVSNLAASDGVKVGQHLGVFRKDADTLREIGRARIVKVGDPYTVCASVSRSEFVDMMEEETVPRTGDLILVR